ncbi:MAG TPA: tRNA-uridine aminocarboxypropyltransferase [Myxococcales bacterium]|nr:tRNA-uridine aminocarboxypropyltransferase [Myxococcales bacterium]
MSRSSTPADFAGRCRACFFRLEVCLCDRIPRVRARTEVVILRHVKEAFKSTNTARLAALALERAALHTYGAPGSPFQPSLLAGEGTWLLFPGPGGAPGPAGSPARLLVLDGSWGQARRMVQRLPALRALPRLSLPPHGQDRVRMRRPPSPEGLSTLEAIAFALGSLEGEQVQRPLLELYELAVQRVLLTRGRLGGRPGDATPA